jgi:hypothetical protein
MRVVLVAAIALGALCGCSVVNLNTGETDYRISDDSTGELKIKYDGLKGQSTRLIVSDQSVSVSLLQVFIKDFSERAERIVAATGLGTVRGEIAVIGRVFELKDGETLDFRRSATKKGRLVFYSNDVRSGGHLLNGSAIPLYGPITYEGRPLVFELTILELDVGEAQQVKSLLSTLATLGAKAYAPASPILNTLDKLGEQLLSGEQDDIEFRYYFALYPNGGSDVVAYPRLAVGNYVLMRQEPNWASPTAGMQQGFNPIVWNSLKYSPNHGRVVACTGAGRWPDCPEYRDLTYMVLQINTGFPTVGLDVAQKFSDFQVEMEGAPDTTARIDALSGAIDKFREQASDARAKNAARQNAEQVKALIKDVCEDAAKRDLNAVKLHDALVLRLGMPLNPSATPPAHVQFTDAQWAAFVDLMREQSTGPMTISRSAVEGAADAAALRDLMTCVAASP